MAAKSAHRLRGASVCDVLSRVTAVAMLVACVLVGLVGVLVGVQVAQVRQLQQAARDLEMSVFSLQREYADLRLSRESELMRLEGRESTNRSQ